MSFSIGGIASGLDTNTIISQLMEVEKLPLTRMENNKSVINAKQDVFRSVNSKLSKLRDLAFDLSQVSTFRVSTAQSSDETTVNVHSSSATVEGAYEIEVEKLAKAQAVHSQSFAKSDTVDASFLTQSLTIRNGDQTVDITLEATENNTYGELLNQISQKINAANVGLNASVIETSSGNISLVLTSKETGSEHRMVFGTEADGSKIVFEDQGLLSALGIQQDGNEVAEQNVSQQYQDAVFTVNGLEVTRSTNRISDVIDGVSFQLNKESSSAIIEVTQDHEQVADKIEEFVNAYNDVVSSIRGLIEKDGALQGDSTLRDLDTQLYRMVTRFVPEAAEGFQTLEQIGISIDKGKYKDLTGLMDLDKDLLLQKLNEDSDAVMGLFRNDGGIAKTLDDELKVWTNSVDGIITEKIKGYDSQVKFIDERIEQMNLRLEQKEEQLRRKFTAMEVALANLQAQQTWLSSQLSTLQTPSSSS